MRTRPDAVGSDASARNEASFEHARSGAIDRVQHRDEQAKTRWPATKAFVRCRKPATGSAQFRAASNACGKSGNRPSSIFLGVAWLSWHRRLPEEARMTFRISRRLPGGVSLHCGAGAMGARRCLIRRAATTGRDLRRNGDVGPTAAWLGAPPPSQMLVRVHDG